MKLFMKVVVISRIVLVMFMRLCSYEIVYLILEGGLCVCVGRGKEIISYVFYTVLGLLVMCLRISYVSLVVLGLVVLGLVMRLC